MDENDCEPPPEIELLFLPFQIYLLYYKKAIQERRGNLNLYKHFIFHNKQKIRVDDGENSLKVSPGWVL